MSSSDAGPAPARVAPEGREYLVNDDLVRGRVMDGGVLERAEEHLGDYMQFFENPAPGTHKHFTLIPIWRLATCTNRHFDEVSICVSPLGNKYLICNGKDAHGTWVYNDPASEAQFLDIKLNVRFGEPEPGMHDDPDDGKWTRFQRFPGTKTWFRCEKDHDLDWTCVMVDVHG